MAATIPLWQSLATALSPAVVAGLAALGGVALTNDALRRHRAEDRRQREAARLLEAEAGEARGRRDRGLAALALAEHLEDFVLHCLDVVESFRNVVWKSPYGWDENTGAPLGLKPLPEWPPLVDWRFLGLDTAVKATNFRRKVQLRRAQLDAGANFLDGEQNHADEADHAASLALEAWDLATAVRRGNQLDPFEWPAGWSGIEVFREHIARRKEVKAMDRGAGALDLD